MSGTSSSTAPLPELFLQGKENLISKLPRRLSNNPNLIPSLASNFRAFAERSPFPPSSKARLSYLSCTDASHLPLHFKPLGPNFSERQISSILNTTLTPLLVQVFDDFVNYHQHCQRLKNAKAHLSLNQCKTSLQRGQVDETIQMLTGAETEMHATTCMWIDYKNPAVLQQHGKDIRVLVDGGHRMNWQTSSTQLGCKSLLLKVRTPKLQIGSSADGQHSRRHTTTGPKRFRMAYIRRGNKP
jgi:hypothetical protein